VRADILVNPYPYRVTTPNGRFVFVMLDPELKYKPAIWITKDGEEERAIRAKYKQSGLYRTDDAHKPLWTVDWYEHEAYPASDGVHLVRPGPAGTWKANFEDQLAVAFYANGQLIRSYKIGELVDQPERLRRSASLVWWRESDAFDDGNLWYTLVTGDGKRFVFDAQTGEIIEGRWRWGRLALIFGAIFALIAAT
jgi:hypothetical protein